MKKSLYLGIAALAALAFTACQKETATPVESSKNLVTVTFSAQKAGDLTKTAAVEGESSVSYVWTDEDAANIKLFTVEDGALSAEIANPVIAKVSDTQLTISAQVEPNATYTFRAILCDPESYTGSGDYTSRKPKIKATQSPGTSNFDPIADILVSDDFEVTVGEEDTDTGDMLLTFRRQVVVNKMTLKNMVAGELVNKVVIKSDKELTGYIQDGALTGQLKELSLSYDDVAVSEDGQFVAYFITMANTGHTLTVEVYTNLYTYTKTFAKTIDFNLGEFTKFGVTLPAGSPVSDLSGYYLIGCLYGGKWQLMDSEINTNGSNHYYPRYESSVTTAAADVEFSDFSGIANIDKYLWHVEAYDGAYSIRSVDTNNYLSYSGSANAAQAVGELGVSAKFAISISGTTATIESSNVAGRVLKYNSSSPRFAFYASGQQAIYMIPATFDTRTPVTLSFADANLTFNTDNYAEFGGQDVAADPDLSAILDNIEWSYEDPDGIIEEFYNGALELNGNMGSATVTASFAGDETYRDAEASYTITVTEAGAVTYHYEAMTSAPDDWTSETFIIVANTSVLNTSSTSSWGKFTTITKESDGTIQETDELKKCEVVADGDETNGFTLQFVNADTQYYIVPLTSKSFTLDSSVPTSKMALSVSDISVKSSTGWKLRLNGASGYRWYSSATGTVAVLYKKVADEN